MVYYELNIRLVNDHYNFFSLLRLLWIAYTAVTSANARTPVLNNKDMCCRI